MANMLQKFKVLLNSSSSKHLLINNTLQLCPNERPVVAALLQSLRLVNSDTSVVRKDDGKPKEKVSRAMRAYLDRAKEHDEFMKTQQTEFQIGKRHLANMMGMDADAMTQKDIDRAIAYLFPSGLFEPKARPIMRPPEEVFPQRKAAEFDESGRPHHYLFYTMNANFYQLLHDTVTHLEQLDKEEDQMIKQKGQVDPDLRLDVSGSEWLPKEILESMLVERIGEPQYIQFQAVMSRLLEHPLSSHAKDHINKYRKLLLSQNKTKEIPKPVYDEEGRAYITVKECLRKKARAEVTVRMPGTGQFSINGQDVTYFDCIQSREQLLFPLIFTALVDRVDVEAKVEGGGPTGQAGAIRWGLANGLCSFVDDVMVEKMRLAGLLQRDYRTVERQKPGQPGARKKPTWKKR